MSVKRMLFPGMPSQAPARRALPHMPAKSDSGVPEFPCGPRGVETNMLKSAMPWALALIPVVLLGAWAFGGTKALLSAGIGVVLGMGNLWLSAFIMERCARIGGNALLAGALFGFLGRLILLTGIVFGLKQLPFISVVPLVIVLVISYLGLLVAEAIVVTADDRRRTRERVLGRAATSERNAA